MSHKKYPKEVKAIYIAGAAGKEGHEVDSKLFESERPYNVSRAARGWDREMRAMSLAASEFFKTYVEHHDASNEQAKDGALKHLGTNTVKAHKAAIKVLKNNSQVFDHNPADIHDKVVEYLEDLEDELENEDDKD